MTEQETIVQEAEFTTVKDVKPRRYGFNLLVKVLSAESTTAKSKTGEEYQVCEGVVGDSTGVIKFRFTGENAQAIAQEVNSVVSFRSCSSTLFKRIIQLRLNKYGKIVKQNSTIAEINSENNLSKNEFPKRPPTERTERAERGERKPLDGGYRKKEDVEAEKRDRQEQRDKQEKTKHPREDDRDYFIVLKDLKPGFDGENVIVKILTAKTAPYKRKDGKVIYTCEGKCGDSTGTIKYRVTNGNAEKIEKLNNTVVSFINLKSFVYKGFHQIEMDRFSKLNSETKTIERVAEENDLSAIEYEKKTKEPAGDKPKRVRNNNRERRERKSSNNSDRNNSSRRRRDSRDGKSVERKETRRRPRNDEDAPPQKIRERQVSEPRVEDSKIISLKDLKPGFNGSNVFVKVLTVNRTSIKSKNGVEIPVCSGKCGDETAVIKYRVTREFADVLEKSLNQVVCFRNCQSNVFKGFHDIGADKYSRVTPETKVIKDINEGNDLSGIEYERKVVKPAAERRETNNSDSRRTTKPRGNNNNNYNNSGSGRTNNRRRYSNDRYTDDDNDYKRDRSTQNNTRSYGSTRYDRDAPRTSEREPYAKQNK